MSNFNLFNIGKAMKEGWKLSGDQEGLVLMKDSAKLVFSIKIMTKNGVILCSAMLTSTSVAMSIEKAHILSGHLDEEETDTIELKFG